MQDRCHLGLFERSAVFRTFPDYTYHGHAQTIAAGGEFQSNPPNPTMQAVAPASEYRQRTGERSSAAYRERLRCSYASHRLS